MELPKTRAFKWKAKSLVLLDQRLLPHKTVWRTYRTATTVAQAIRAMVVRGAPAIGCTAAYGLVLAAREKVFRSVEEQSAYLNKVSSILLAARPTAVNLRWALERMSATWTEVDAFARPAMVANALEQEAQAIEEEDRAANRQMGLNGAALLPENAVVMTICNTGSLATAGLGTAFGILWTAYQQGKINNVIVSETRPYLQGARLTAWELLEEGIPFELMTDSMAAHLMKTEKIDAVIVGADRIAANGDTANKIGTYNLAVLAKHHGIPFYVAAPTSTLDLRARSEKDIPIEERSSDEVVNVLGKPVAPRKTKARHPAFDVSPASMIAAIITEKGVAKPPYLDSLYALTQREVAAAL